MTVGKHTATVVVTGETKDAAGARQAAEAGEHGKEAGENQQARRRAGKTLSDPSKLGKAQSAFQGLTSSVGLLRAGRQASPPGLRCRR